MRCVTTRFIAAAGGVMCCDGVCEDRSEEVTSTPVQERGNNCTHSALAACSSDTLQWVCSFTSLRHVFLFDCQDSPRTWVRLGR